MIRWTKGRVFTLMALFAASLLLFGCGGDDGYSISAEDQARIDTLTADLAAARAAAQEAADDLAAANTKATADLAAAQGRLEAAQEMVASLTTEIGMMPTDDADGSGLRGQLAMAQADLAAAQMQVGALTTEIGMMPTDDADGSGLKGDLATAQAALAAANTMVDTLTAQLGTMPSDDGTEGGSGIRKQLAEAQAEVASLTTMIGMVDDPDTEADEASGLKGDLAAAEAMRDEYMTKATDLTTKIGMMADAEAGTEATGLYKKLADAEAARDMYKAMIDKEDDPDTEADESGLKQQLAAAKAEVTRLTGELKKANDALTTAQGDLTAAQDKAEEDAAMVLASTRAREVVDALDGERSIVEIEFDSKGNVEIVEPDGRAWDDADPLVEFTDWDAESYTRDTRRTDPDGTETIHIYTAKTDKQTDEFENVYTLDANGRLVLGAVAAPAATTPAIFTVPAGLTATQTFDVKVGDVTVKLPGNTTSATSEARVIFPLSMVNNMPVSSKITFDQAFDRDDRLIVDTPTALLSPTTAEGQPGKFDGVDGTFYCIADTCTVFQDDDGNLYIDAAGTTVSVADNPDTPATTDLRVTVGALGSGVGQTLHFLPDDDDDLVTVSKAQYLAWGAWFEKPEDADRNHRFDAFTASSGPAVGASDISALELDGTAKYTGGAAGKWATQDLAANTADAGYFTADVNLTAEFDDGVLDDLGGRIRDFEEGGESLGNWYIDLEMDGMDAEAKVGRATIDGSWTYSMHGQVEADDMDERYPEAILGTFKVGDDGDPALLSGAFGTLNTD